ncbi:MAG: HlyD family efflux transporter periplasmic adaptor subunit [Candidatus Eremiobacteraeota bacterium]|nr:HlyD family efflux transporter periplasmic adaptor subunit [Candidatus Eremiobacteraeota bacterium]
MHTAAIRASVFFIFLFTFSACANSNKQFQYSGTLLADSARVGSTIGGRVTAVYVSDGQRVHRNQILVRLQESDQRAGLMAALSQEAQAAAALANLEAGSRPAEIARAAAGEGQVLAGLRKAQVSTPDVISQAYENVRQAAAALRQTEAAATQASLNYQRVTRLYKQGAVAAQARDDARTADQQARAAVHAAQARLAAAQAALAQTSASAPQDVAAAQHAYEAAAANRQLVQQGARPQEIAQARAGVNAAKANVDAAQARLAEMVIKAPADGIIEQIDLHPGDLVSPRAPVALLSEFHDPYVRVYISQRDLQRVQTGQQVRVRSDAAGNEEFSGTVEQIDQQAQFTPRDVQTAADRADLAFGVKVRVHDPDHRLHSGTTAEVAIP